MPEHLRTAFHTCLLCQNSTTLTNIRTLHSVGRKVKGAQCSPEFDPSPGWPQAQAKRDGKLDDGVVDVQGTVTLLDPPSTLALDRVSSAACKLYSLTVDQGITLSLGWHQSVPLSLPHNIVILSTVSSPHPVDTL